MIREWCAAAGAVFGPVLKPMFLAISVYSGLLAMDHLILLWVRAQ